MSEFPDVINVDPIVISTATPQSIGIPLNAGAFNLSATAWSTANKAIFVPVSIATPVTIVKMFVINGAVSGNIDVGIYDMWGTRLVSAGSTPQAGSGTVQSFDIADTTLNPGMYYLACAMDNTSGALQIWTPNTAVARAFGASEQTSAFPLPATITPAILNTGRIPFIGATQRTVI